MQGLKLLRRQASPMPRIKNTAEVLITCWKLKILFTVYARIPIPAFVTRSDRAREIVEEIMAQAVEEVDYKPPQFAFDLQIMILPEQGMILTFTEKSNLTEISVTGAAAGIS